MSFSYADRKVASEVRKNLADHVAAAKKTSPREEFPLIEASAQIVHFAMQGVDDEHLVEINVAGSLTPSTGEVYFNTNVRATAIKTKQIDAAPERPWTPDQGPLSQSESFPMVNGAPSE